MLEDTVSTVIYSRESGGDSHTALHTPVCEKDTQLHLNFLFSRQLDIFLITPKYDSYLTLCNKVGKYSHYYFFFQKKRHRSVNCPGSASFAAHSQTLTLCPSPLLRRTLQKGVLYQWLKVTPR